MLLSGNKHLPNIAMFTTSLTKVELQILAKVPSTEMPTSCHGSGGFGPERVYCILYVCVIYCNAVLKCN